MARDADWLASSNEGLDWFNGMLVFGEIAHRALATRVEDGVEVFLPEAVEANGLAELSLRDYPRGTPGSETAQDCVAMPGLYLGRGANRDRDYFYLSDWAAAMV